LLDKHYRPRYVPPTSENRYKFSDYFWANKIIVISDKSNTSYTDKVLMNSSIDILNLN